MSLDTSASATAPSIADDLGLALRLADAADEISMSRFRANDLHIETKPDRSHVTDADRAVETAIRELLAAERPGDAILGEEFGVEGTSSRRWIIDPIDGTHNYERGLPLWGTLIALADGDDVVVGVASMPTIDRRWWASRGSGSWTSELAGGIRRLHVSGIADLAHASISFQSIAQWDRAGYIDRLLDLTRVVWRDRGYGDLWPYTFVAEGMLEMVGEFDVKPYDLSPLAIIVEEAGGRFTSVDGKPGPWHGSSLATNGLLHDEFLARLA